MSGSTPHLALTRAVIASMKSADTGPWHPPWDTRIGFPINHLTELSYTDLSVLMLTLIATRRGYETNRWASPRQWQSIGGQVRKGAKGVPVAYAGIPPEDPTSEAPMPEDGTHDRPAELVVRRYTVFNLDQVDGIDYRTETPSLGRSIVEADRFVAITGAQIRWGEEEAFYAPGRDLIGMPYRESFHSLTGLYTTLFHGLTHWTGHRSRLRRKLKDDSDHRAHALEELIAELGAHCLAARHNLATDSTQDGSRFLKSWIGLLESNPLAFMFAASHAAFAADWLVDLVERGGEPGE